jgi:hypothetical protein
VSPVQQTRARDPRSLTLAVVGLLIGLALLLILFFFAIPKLTSTGTVKINVGSDGVPLGNAEVKAADIAQDGPLLLPDPAGGDHDIFVQHLGDDPLKGWLAFDARRAGTSRDCTLTWNNTTKVFTDPCTHETVPADGGTLARYKVVVGDDEQLSLNLNPNATTPGTTEQAPPSTIAITGSLPRSS